MTGRHKKRNVNTHVGRVQVPTYSPITIAAAHPQKATHPHQISWLVNGAEECLDKPLSKSARHRTYDLLFLLSFMTNNYQDFPHLFESALVT